MEPVSEALSLLRRQAEIEAAMRQPGGIRVTEERELYALRERLRLYPVAVGAILETAQRLRRPVEAISSADIEAV